MAPPITPLKRRALELAANPFVLQWFENRVHRLTKRMGRRLVFNLGRRRQQHGVLINNRIAGHRGLLGVLAKRCTPCTVATTHV